MLYTVKTRVIFYRSMAISVAGNYGAIVRKLVFRSDNYVAIVKGPCHPFDDYIM